ncbi:MAG: YegP family protein [Clostridia bacterium]|nr:YegP family protein [Clostridia bacterium]
MQTEREIPDEEINYNSNMPDYNLAPDNLTIENRSEKEVQEEDNRIIKSAVNADSDNTDTKEIPLADFDEPADVNEVAIAENSKQDEKQTDSEPATLKYTGKWVIYEDDGRFFADLKASNGEIMLRTESYSSLSGIKSGIDTLKKNIEMENYAINLDKNGNFVFKIFSTAKRLLCIGEGYNTREQCEKAFASVKRFSKTAKIVRDIGKE